LGAPKLMAVSPAKQKLKLKLLPAGRSVDTSSLPSPGISLPDATSKATRAGSVRIMR
jgi:hypothetical protein